MISTRTQWMVMVFAFLLRRLGEKEGTPDGILGMRLMGCPLSLLEETDAMMGDPFRVGGVEIS